MRNEFDNANLIYTSILLLFFALGMVGLSRSQLYSKFKMLIIWGVLILAVVAAYSYWADVKNSRFYASLVPGSVVTNNAGEMEFAKASDGHFYIDALVNGKEVHFMVDTGASDIVLSQNDAAALGIDLNALQYNKIYSTANGSTRGASVRLSYLKVGGFEMQGFYASVNEGKLSNSLLGMAFLGKFREYRVQGNKLVLKP